MHLDAAGSCAAGLHLSAAQRTERRYSLCDATLRPGLNVTGRSLAAVERPVNTVGCVVRLSIATSHVCGSRLWGYLGLARPPHSTLADGGATEFGLALLVFVSPLAHHQGPDHYRTGRQPHRRRQRGRPWSAGSGRARRRAAGGAVAWAHRRAPTGGGKPAQPQPPPISN